MKDLMKNMLLWVTVAIVLMMVFQGFSPRAGGSAAGGSVLYSEFVDAVRNDRIRKVDIADDGRTIEFERKDNSKGTTIAPRDDLRPDEFDKTIAVNLRGTYLTLHLTVPHLRKAGGGTIVVVSSINGTRTFTTPGATAYSATKAAQVAMVQQLALELGKAGIRVNAVCPGAIETSIDENTDQRGAGEAGIPVVWPEGDIPVSGGAPGTAQDIADAILFLASSKARHITGAPLWIEGPDENAKKMGMKPLISGERSEDEGLFVCQHDYWAQAMRKGVQQERAGEQA